jgi:hypothetical protein
VAEMAVWGVYFEHLYTAVNGVGNLDINSCCAWTMSMFDLRQHEELLPGFGPAEMIAGSVTSCDIV